MPGAPQGRREGEVLGEVGRGSNSRGKILKANDTCSIIFACKENKVMPYTSPPSMIAWCSLLSVASRALESKKIGSAAFCFMFTVH